MKRYLLDLYRRRDLVALLVTSGLKAQHRNSMLGYLWWLLDPFLGVLIYYFVVVTVFRRGGEGYGPFLVVGMVVWRWLGATTSAASQAIVKQAGIITHVELPKIVFPIAEAATGLVHFGFGLVVVMLLFLAWHILPGVALLSLPLIVVSQFLFTLALASMIAYVGVFLRDLEPLMGHLLRLWFFASPVIWRPDMVPAEATSLLPANPMSHLLAAYRDVLIGQRLPSLGPLAVIGIASAIAVAWMTYVYSRHEHRMVRVL